MRTRISRRLFLGASAVGAGVVLGVRGAYADAPPETGLSSEGLLAGLPGFQPRTVAPLSKDELEGFLSRGQLAAHHAEYAKVVESLKQAEAALATADRGASAAAAYAALRRRQVASANSMLLPELYFRNLAPQPVELPRYLKPHVREHMGSLESWTEDFKACALAAKAWALLVYDPYDDRWHNAIMDGDADSVWIGANPLVVCDVAEHAYATDYKRKEDYVARFLERIDWGEVASRYRKVDRM